MKILGKSTIIIITCLLFTLLTGCLLNENKSKDKKIKDLMDQYHDLGQFNGSVLVSKGDNIIYKSGYGLANREWNTYNDPETKYRLGSITKQFTAAIILKLVEDGKLSLDQKIIEILPNFNQESGLKVSIHHLLTHTSGIPMPQLSREEYDDIFQNKQSTEQLIKKLCNEDLAFNPGSEFRYSSAGYIILGAIIERITAKTWEESIKEYILDPLEMNDTGVDDYEKIIPKRASGYQTNYGNGNAHFKYMPSSFSSGALYSTVEDMHKWFVGLCNNKVISSNLKDLMFSKHIGKHPRYFGYGCFVDEVEVNDSIVKMISHAGDVHGFSAIILGNPQNQEAVVLLSNQEGTHYYEIANNLFNILNDLDVDTPKKYVADVLRETIYASGIEMAKNKYYEMTELGFENFNTDISELIELAQDLQYTGKIKESIEVLNITSSLHPDSYYVFECLGEALFIEKNFKLAIQNFKKSYTLNPENINALHKINEIEKMIEK